MKRLIQSAIAVAALGLPIAAQAAQPAQAATIWDNCTTYNHVYPHGVGRLHAVDHTSGTPVRNFVHSTVKYNRAMTHNRDLDRDRDGIACEKL